MSGMMPPLEEVCRSIEMSLLGKAMVSSTWFWPAVESLHVTVLVVLLANVMTYDLRLMGLALRRFPVSQVGTRLLPFAWVAFSLMIVTGVLLFAPFATNYCVNSSFRVKVALIGLAGINVVAFHFTTYRSVTDWDDASSTPLFAKVAGAASVVLWAGVVAAGRLIGFVG
jgi:hypothetical protein